MGEQCKKRQTFFLFPLSFHHHCSNTYRFGVHRTIILMTMIVFSFLLGNEINANIHLTSNIQSFRSDYRERSGELHNFHNNKDSSSSTVSFVFSVTYTHTNTSCIFLFLRNLSAMVRTCEQWKKLWCARWFFPFFFSGASIDNVLLRPFSLSFSALHDNNKKRGIFFACNQMFFFVDVIILSL